MSSRPGFSPSPATLESTRSAIASMNAAPRLPASLGDGRLLSGGVKLYVDGSGGARTAWMYDEWNRDLTATDAGNHGYPAHGPGYPQSFRRQVAMLTEAGIHVGAHAVGDRAIDWVVDTYAEVLAAQKTRACAIRSSTRTCPPTMPSR
jgi:predicted amidohydrolase YtcJ